jgi:hypothetical protein
MNMDEKDGSNMVGLDNINDIISQAKANLADEDAAYRAWYAPSYTSYFLIAMHPFTVRHRQLSVEKMATRIFRAKCDDIGVNLTSHREDRFVANMILLCKQGKLSLTDQGL